jgi:NADH-quinone oxidoreductase subunit C
MAEDEPKKRPAPAEDDASEPVAPGPGAAAEKEGGGKADAKSAESEPEAKADAPVKDPEVAASKPAEATKDAPAKKPEAAKAEAEKEPAPPPRTFNEDTQAFLREKEFYAPEQVDDIKTAIPAFKVPREKLVDAVRYLRDILHYEHLSCITAIDWKEGRLEVVYNLWSYSKNRPLAVRVECTVEDPVVPSVTTVWAGAAWLEREEYDLMGIHFEGNPDLRRILLPEGWKGHPLRKDYDWKKEQYVGMDRQGNDVVYQEPREDAW